MIDGLPDNPTTEVELESRVDQLVKKPNVVVCFCKNKSKSTALVTERSAFNVLVAVVLKVARVTVLEPDTVPVPTQPVPDVQRGVLHVSAMATRLHTVGDEHVKLHGVPQLSTPAQCVAQIPLGTHGGGGGGGGVDDVAFGVWTARFGVPEGTLVIVPLNAARRRRV